MILDAIMVACIDSFDAIRAEYAWYDDDYDPAHRHYQLWLRGDAPFPNSANYGRFKSNHAPSPVAEHWHSGTRFVWPDHDPRLIRQE
jgi:hypothetical protein